jgi:gas vesicle protein
MDDERSGGASGVILSFVVGALTGAALAILFAPRSGKETRELLGEKLRESTERGRELKDQVAAKGRHLVAEAGDYVERQREVLKESRDRLAAAVEAGREAYRADKKEHS